MPSSQTATPQIEQVELKPSQLVPHKNNIRADVGDVTDLAESVKAKGVLQPLVVVPNGKPDRYVIIAGHRRHAAAKVAKVKSVPCVIRHDLTDEADQIAVMMVENGQRTDLTAVEEAKGVQTLLDLGDTQKKISERTGMSATKVRQRAKVAKLPDELSAKLTKHAVTLDDAVFVADHTDNADDLALLEDALGTNNWAVTRQKVIDRVASRKREAKLLADLAKTGLTVIDADWEARRGKTDEIAERLGCRRIELIESANLGLRDWTPASSLLDRALAAPENAFVFIERYTNAATAELRVYAAPAPATVGSDTPPTTPTPAATPNPATPADDDDEDEPVGPTPEQIERQQRREALDAATTVRRDFIAGVIAGGKLEHAQLAGQTAPAAGDYIELGWGDVLPFLPIRNEYVGQSMSSDEMREVVTEWVDRQTNPYVLCLTLAWVFLTWIDGHLVSTLNPNYLDAEELRAVDRYALLLETCGYVFSDIELEGINAVREALVQEEPDTEDADG